MAAHQKHVADKLEALQSGYQRYDARFVHQIARYVQKKQLIDELGAAQIERVVDELRTWDHIDHFVVATLELLDK